MRWLWKKRENNRSFWRFKSLLKLASYLELENSLRNKNFPVGKWKSRWLKQDVLYQKVMWWRLLSRITCSMLHFLLLYKSWWRLLLFLYWPLLCFIIENHPTDSTTLALNALYRQSTTFHLIIWVIHSRVTFLKCHITLQCGSTLKLFTTESNMHTFLLTCSAIHSFWLNCHKLERWFGGCRWEM